MKLIISIIPVFLLMSGCSLNNETGNGTIITYNGGKITSDDIDKKAGNHLKKIRQKVYEIKYRIAMEILIDKLQILEEKKNTNNASDSQETSEKKLEMDELDRLLKKYNVKNFLQMPK